MYGEGENCMKLENLKNIFISYLEENNKLKEIGENNENVNYEDISIFTYANEFKSFLESEYDASETDIMSKSISDILNMEIEFGKLVDKTENEDTEIEKEDNESINTNRVISSVEDKIENELGSDMSRRDAKNIVERFDGKISDAVNDEILEGEISNFDIFKDVFNELGKNTKFVEAIDVDKSNDISQNELEDFLNSIKGFDDNQEDVSVNDLLTAATQINEGRFQFISQTNNHADIKNTNSVSSTTNNVPTVETTTPQKVNSVDSEMSNISTGNTSSVGNTSNCGNTNLNSVMDFGSGAGSNLDSMTSELEGLQTEKTETEQDLSTQTDKLDSTQNEKEQVVGDLCSEIETGNQDLTTAQDDVSTTQEQRDTAATDVENAQQQTQCSKTEADNAASDLTNAQNKTDAAQDTSDTAADNNTQAIQAEQTAQDDSNTANDNLTTAVGNTDAAQGVADTKGSELQTAAVEASQAFSVLNVKNQEVQKAQTEYNNAKAQQKNASQNIFQKIANWVSNLFNALSDAIAGRDHAQAEADRKAAEEEKAQIASDEALEALEERKDEQAEAQSVADAAEVVLARATGEREVSDQEYAEALIALASAMESEENAESEYNTAFDNYLQCNNYQVDAEGRLQDAEGNYISATQVAQELETYVLGLVETRDTKETEYDEVIQATTEVIAGDESKIEELDSKITDLQAQIEQEKENIALQEAMITELSTEQSEVNAANESAGIADGFMSLFGAGNAADQKALDDKKAILEEALLSGDSEKIAEAYRAIYGDKEVIVDAAGNVVNPAELTEEQLAQCSVANIKDLSNDNLSSIMHNNAAAINNAAQTMEIINNGIIVCDGEEVSMDVLNEILKEQVAAMAADMDNAVDRQGIISKGAGALNNLLGIGTSETEARAQVDVYLQLAAQLDACTDPVEYAALFKQITGKDFSVETVAELLAYDKVSNGKSTDTKVETDNTATAGKADITEYVNTLTDAVNEDEELNEDALSLTKDNTAREAIEDYKETQETAKDAVIGVVSGVASTVVVTVCSAAGICAAPFTGGASLSLIAAGFGIAGGTGALVSSGLNAIDSIYDADGDGNLDFNYSWKEFGKDFLIGGLNGIVGNLANGAGAAVTGKISTQAAQTAVTTTLKETVKKGAVNFGGKLAGAAVEGFIDGSVSASGEYAINALLDDDVDFSFQQFAETGLQGGIIGSVFNVGMTASTSGLSALADGVQSRNFRADINDFLSEGTTNNQLAELVAGKLDDSLLDADGMVNKYAAGQLMKNAETALDSLQSYYKSINLDPNDAIKALDNISLADMPNVPTMLSALRQLDLPGIDMTTAEGISDGLSKIDGIEVNPNGTLSSMKVISDGQEITFDFDNNGKLTAVGLSNSGNDVDIDLDDADIHIDGDDIKVDGDDVKVDGDDIKVDGDDLSENLTDKYVDTPITPEEAVDTINKLADMGKLPKDIDFNRILSDPESVSKEFYDDLNKLYQAYSEGIDIQKVFVPEFSNLDDAIKAIKVGDVCTVDGGDTIGIKLANGTIQNLNISAETYMELFPPASRFASMQGEVGDCYLISSLDLMFKTPETRVKLLQCFTEHPDGSITVKIGNIERSFDSITAINDIINENSLRYGGRTNVNGSNGFKMLEEVFGYNYIDIKTNQVMQNLQYYRPGSKEYKEALDLLDRLKNPNRYISDIALDARSNGGWMHDVFEIFGLENAQYISNPEAIKNILLNQDNWDKIIMTLCSNGTSDRTFLNTTLQLAASHAYGVQPYIYNGQIMFKIINPWDSAVNLNLTIDEILQYFRSLSIAKKA